LRERDGNTSAKLLAGLMRQENHCFKKWSFLLTFSWNDAKLFLYVSSCLVMLTKGELRW
jgi:hypothetical protein